MYYAITELPPPSGSPTSPTGVTESDAVALNDNGDAAGHVLFAAPDSGEEYYGAIWYADGSTLLLPEFSYISDINAEGTAAGVESTDSYEHAILVQNKTVVDLESVAGMISAAYCINNGFNGPSLVCVSSEGGDLLGIDSVTHKVAKNFTQGGNGAGLRPATINDNSDIAGWTITEEGFLYKGGVVTNNTPAGGIIYKLNNSGQGGGCYGGATGPGAPAIWDITGSMPITKLPLPLGCEGGLVYGINDSGWAVGYCFNSVSPNTSYAFVYDGSKMTDLNTLIAAPGWILESANAINNSGQILGTGTLNGAPTSFLLTPIASPWQSANVNALLYAMLFGGVANDGGGPTLLGGRIPYPVGPWDPSILLPAAQDAVIGLAVDAVARRLGDRGGSEAIRRAALEMTGRAISRLMAPTISNASQSVPRPRAAARPVRPRGRFPFPPRPGSKPPKG
jgi:probable HAF family extracellular repeat protein